MPDLQVINKNQQTEVLSLASGAELALESGQVLDLTDINLDVVFFQVFNFDLQIDFSDDSNIILTDFFKIDEADLDQAPPAILLQGVLIYPADFVTTVQVDGFGPGILTTGEAITPTSLFSHLDISNSLDGNIQSNDQAFNNLLSELGNNTQAQVIQLLEAQGDIPNPPDPEPEPEPEPPNEPPVQLSMLGTLDVSPSNEDLVFRFAADDINGNGLDDNPPDGSEVVNWIDRSTNNNNATTPGGGNDPTYRATGYNGGPGIEFDQTNDEFRINSSPSINTANVYEAKTIQANFQTGDDISGFQVIYEQGGGTRGYNISIFDGKLYAFVYNRNQWGATDEERYKSIVLADDIPDNGIPDLLANTVYEVYMVQDSTSAVLADNTFKGYLNGVLIDTIFSVPPQNAHGALIGVGGIVSSTRQPADGFSNQGNGANFDGVISNLTSWNRALTIEEINANAVSVADAGVVISNELLEFEDPDNLPEELVYNVTANENGSVVLTSDPTTVVTSFTQADINLGNVLFFQDSLVPSSNPDIGTLTVELTDGEFTSDPITITFAITNQIVGTAGAETIGGTDNSDVIIGDAGADLIFAGDGNDFVEYDATDVEIDGGQGDFDILQLSGDGELIDLSALPNIVTSFEGIQLLGANQTVNLNPADIVDLSDTDNFYIYGDSDDAVSGDFTGWSLVGTEGDFIHFTSADMSTNLYVQSDINTDAIII